jgi:tRNA dimethylallyltransferase
MNTKAPLVVIAGPTASGKSALALALSRLTPATIINADASQVYRDLRIVSARPSVDDIAQAPHSLFGYLDGTENCSAARWSEDAKTAISEAQDAGRLPVLVGGTGLYLRTLLDGMAPVPDIDPAIRTDIRSLTASEAHLALLEFDPAAAAKLNPNDTTRVARALEVVRSTGRRLDEWQKVRAGGIGATVNIAAMILLPPRDWLRERCDTRFNWMLENGAIAEVEALIARRIDLNLPVMRAIGVAEIARIIADPANRTRYAEEAKAATRQYAKRQYTWFRNQSPQEWDRFETQLNPPIVNELAIKLRNMTLTC